MKKRFGWRGVNGRAVSRQAKKPRKPQDLADLLYKAATEAGIGMNWSRSDFAEMLEDGTISTEAVAGGAVSADKLSVPVPGVEKPLTASDILENRRRWLEEHSLRGKWPAPTEPGHMSLKDMADRLASEPNDMLDDVPWPATVRYGTIKASEPISLAPGSVHYATEKDAQELFKKCRHRYIKYSWTYERDNATITDVRVRCDECDRDVTEELGAQVFRHSGNAVSVGLRDGRTFWIGS